MHVNHIFLSCHVIDMLILYRQGSLLSNEAELILFTSSGICTVHCYRDKVKHPSFTV